MVRFIGVMVVAAVLTSCAAMTEPLDAGVPRIDTTGMKAGCFDVNEVREWVPLTELNLLVYAPTRSEPRERAAFS